jgi:hypothetical protein
MRQLRKERKLATQQLHALKTKAQANKLKELFARAFKNDRYNDLDKSKDDILRTKIENLQHQIGGQTRMLFRIQWCMWSM